MSETTPTAKPRKGKDGDIPLNEGPAAAPAPEAPAADAPTDPGANRWGELIGVHPFYRSSVPQMQAAGVKVEQQGETLLIEHADGTKLQLLTHNEFVCYATGWFHGRDKRA